MSLVAAPTETAGEEHLPPHADRKPTLWTTLASRYGLLGVWVVLAAVFGALRPSTFLTLGNFQSLFDSQSILLFLSLGLVISLVSGDFNLAIPGIFSASLVLLGDLNGEHNVNFVVAIVCALGLSVAAGLVQALLVVRMRLSSFIVTLGTGTAFMGLGYAINSTSIANLSPSYLAISTTQVAGLQLVFVYAVVATVVVWWVYRFTPLGRQLHFTGSSREVARLAGLNVNLLRTISLVASSTMGGVAAVFGGAFLGEADPTLASSFLLPMFSATLLGSTAVTPGRPNAWGTFIAAYFLVTGYSGLEQLGLSGWVEQVFYGSALVVALVVSTYVGRRAGVGDSVQLDA